MAQSGGSPRCSDMSGVVGEADTLSLRPSGPLVTRSGHVLARCKIQDFDPRELHATPIARFSAPAGCRPHWGLSRDTDLRGKPMEN